MQLSRYISPDNPSKACSKHQVTNLVLIIQNSIKILFLLFSEDLKFQKLKARFNKMKYQCSQCSFQWEGTVNTFDAVREHEKTHLKIKQ